MANRSRETFLKLIDKRISLNTLPNYLHLVHNSTVLYTKASHSGTVASVTKGLSVAGVG